MKKEKILEFLKTNKLLIFLVLITIIRQFLVSHLPLLALSNQFHDDNMMYNMAVNIFSGKWLGTYTSDTLVKGAFFPFLLAIIHKVGFSYISSMSIIYIVSCIFFVYTIKDLVKNKKLLAIIYIALIFNPVSYAAWTLQRVYRNGITLSQVLFIIGSMFALYQNRNGSKKKMLCFSIIAGLVLGTFWQTREDGIWILPFVLVVTLIIFINIIIKYRKNAGELIKRIIIVLLPIIILQGMLSLTRFINYKIYGVYTYNEINDGYFGKVLQTMYSVKTDEDIQYVTVTRDKIKKLYEVSPTLNSIKNEFENSLNAWDNNDRNPGDTQVEDGWFWWSLKMAVEDAGYYDTAEHANEFYKQVYEELQTAIDEGKLEIGIKMPSKLMSPWKSRYLGEELLTMAKFTYFVATYDTVETINAESFGDIITIKEYENLTLNKAIYPRTENYIDSYQAYTKPYSNILNKITDVYSMIGLPTAIISFILYIIMTISIILSKQIRKNHLDIWLLETGLACSFLVLLAGVSYNHITACMSKYYMYLSGAYPIVTALKTIVIIYFIDNFKEYKEIFKNRKKKSNV